MVTPEPITGWDADTVGLAETNQDPPCGVGAGLGRGWGSTSPWPSESDDYLNEEWATAGRRSKVRVDLGNNLVSVLISVLT